MIVRESTYRKACAERDALKKELGEIRQVALHLKGKYEALIKDWNSLVRRINANGGESILSGSKPSDQLSSDDIKKLLMLIHPDKHGGKPMAQEMTAKILQIRGGK
jgi:hypothetical protein